MKYTLIIILTIGSLFTSCSKELTTTEEQEIYIPGLWVSEFDYTDVTESGKLFISGFENLDYTYTFNEDGTGIKITYNCNTEASEDYTWYIDDNLLTIERYNGTNETMVVGEEVLTLTKRHLGIITNLFKK